MGKKTKFYVVWEGKEPGVYNTWADCQLQIKGFPNAKYKSFSSLTEAVEAFRGSYWDVAGKNKKTTKKTLSPEFHNQINWDTISVDAACSGNPGVTEYQGVDTKNGTQIFHLKLAIGTNNIGEFLALVHALALLKRENKNTAIYTDSKTAMAWVRRKKANTKFPRNAKTARTWDLIERAENWLKQNTWNNEILKWDTDNWGEIPADFGRK